MCVYRMDNSDTDRLVLFWLHRYEMEDLICLERTNQNIVNLCLAPSEQWKRLFLVELNYNLGNLYYTKDC
jgi:hypothetical protein